MYFAEFSAELIVGSFSCGQLELLVGLAVIVAAVERDVDDRLAVVEVL